MKKSGIAVVTGGSRGIGAATVRLLANNGFRVCVNFHSDEDAASKIVNDFPDGNGIAIQADVSEESAVVRLFEEVDERLGPITALVNNAGIIRQQMRVDRLLNSIPMKRGGEPSEIANAVLWLLSEEASYVTGTFIDAAGGR